MRDKPDLGFFAFADAASLCTSGELPAALRPKSRKRTLLAAAEGLIESALSLRGVLTRKTRDGADLSREQQSVRFLLFNGRWPVIKYPAFRIKRGRILKVSLLFE